MIAAKLRSGKVWDWERGDRLSVNGDELALSDVAELVLEGFVTVRGVDVTVAGQPVRGLVQTDGETGIAVVALWPLEHAREIGRNLASGKVIPATEADLWRMGG